MKHKHYEMIVAKAANMDLIVFYKDTDGEWDVSERDFPAWPTDREYFLCLSQHKEACLHWLNGGDVQYKTNNEWVNASKHVRGCWTSENLLMDGDVEFRIKPKKEKRWIGIYNHNVTSQHFDSIETAKSFIRRRDEFKNCPPEVWQFIEIEVEVK